MVKYLKLLRFKHYIKNLLIFAPILFNGTITNADYLLNTTLAFLAFSAIASAVYIINDLMDMESDRQNPEKKNRPIASREVSPTTAKIAIAIMFVTGIILNWLSCGWDWQQYAYLSVYLILNIGYSCGWKNLALVDVVILASGYVIRVLYGGNVNNIQVSSWLYLTVLSIAFFLGFGKRRNELLSRGEDSRKVLKHYSKEFLDKNMYVCMSLSIVLYALWCVNTQNMARPGGNMLIWSVPIVMIILMRYSMDIEQDDSGDPITVLLKDKILLLLGLLYGTFICFILYVYPLLEGIVF